MIAIDASVAAKWFFKGEKGVAPAQKILSSHVLGVNKILVPDLFFYEIANIVATKGYLSLWKTTSYLTKIYKLELVVYIPVAQEVKQATRLAKKYKTSVYDILYAVVAKNHKVKLITADEQFIKQTGFQFVQLLH